MQNKRAQAAMEFIMTYGWAILAVTVAIGALIYFGVFSPSQLLPEQCRFPAELSCSGKPLASVDTDNISMTLTNNVGFRINLTSTVNATDDCETIGTIWVDGSPAPQMIDHGEKVTLTVDCGTIDSGRFKTDMTLYYYNTNSDFPEPFPITGNIQANAQ